MKDKKNSGLLKELFGLKVSQSKLLDAAQRDWKIDSNRRKDLLDKEISQSNKFASGCRSAMECPENIDFREHYKN